jgi:tetratricopeptide (TPR) repeat protein
MNALNQPANTLGPGDPPAPAPSRRTVALAAGLLVLAALAAYWNTFSAPFVFDDVPGIIDNPSIRHLWPLSTVLQPLAIFGSAAGRPVVNLSLAINYAIGGTDVRGYHALNLVFHVLAALTLFGIVRRTLRLSSGQALTGFVGAHLAIDGRIGMSAVARASCPWIWVRPLDMGKMPMPHAPSSIGRCAQPASLPSDATLLAFAVALLWMLHPLQTESVTCVIQRTELLGGLFYLLTLYSFIGATDAGASRYWQVACVGSCLLGMASKEIMVSTPLMVWLYDRTFVAGSFRAAWRQRSRLYLALGSTWLPLAYLVLGSGGRNGTAGLGLGVTPWEYALTQCHAITLYLRLAFWPHPLVLDYGTAVVRSLREVWPQATVVLALLGLTIWALIRKPRSGFLGFWFFAILAPSSSVMPVVSQTMAEHRMYLPLAAVIVLLVLALHVLAGRRSLAFLALVAIALGIVTIRRNQVYRSVESVWADTVARCPSNVRAYLSLGRTLADSGRTAEAITEYKAAFRLRPDYAEAHTDLGDILSKAGRTEEAFQHLTTALRLKPDSAEAHLNLGTALDRIGRTAEAIAQYELALRLKPRLAEAHNNLGSALLRSGRTAEAIRQIQEALGLKLEYAEAHYNLANAFARAGRLPEAMAEFAAGYRLKPDDTGARHTWANTLAGAGHLPEALPQYETALKQAPDDPELLYDYGNGLGAAGRFPEAARAFTEALRLRPDYPEAHNNLGNALVMLGRVPEAIAQYEAALRLNPANASAHNNFGLALARLGRMPEAAAQFAAAVQLAPDYREARENLARAQAALPGASP